MRIPNFSIAQTFIFVEQLPVSLRHLDTGTLCWWWSPWFFYQTHICFWTHQKKTTERNHSTATSPSPVKVMVVSAPSPVNMEPPAPPVTQRRISTRDAKLVEGAALVVVPQRLFFLQWKKQPELEKDVCRWFHAGWEVTQMGRSNCC